MIVPEKQSEAYTLPPKSLELIVTTTDPMAIKEMTSENTCIACSLGACWISRIQRNGTAALTSTDRIMARDKQITSGPHRSQSLSSLASAYEHILVDAYRRSWFCPPPRAGHTTCTSLA